MKFLNAVVVAFFLCALSAPGQESKPQPAPRFELPKEPSKPPETNDEFYEAARWESFQQRPDKAIALLDVVLTRDPAFTDGYFLRGVIRQQSGDCKRAVPDFDVVIERDPDAINTLQYRAECKIASKDLAGALVDLNQAVTTLSAKGLRQYNAFVNRGKLFYLTGNYNGAIEDFTSAEAMRADSGARFYRALAYLKSGDDLSAITDFRYIGDKFDVSMMEFRARFPEQFAEPPGFPEFYNPFENLKPKKGTYTALPVLVGRGGCDGCDENPTFEDKIKPETWFTPGKLSVLPFSLQKDDMAALFYLLGDALERREETKAAVDAYGRAIASKNFDNVPIRFRRARANESLGNFEEAVRDYSWILEETRGQVGLLNRGLALLMLDRDDLADKDFAAYKKQLAKSPELLDAADKMIAERKAIRLKNRKVRPN